MRRASVRVLRASFHKQLVCNLVTRQQNLFLAQNAELNNVSIKFGPSVEDGNEVSIRAGELRGVADYRPPLR